MLKIKEVNDIYSYINETKKILKILKITGNSDSSLFACISISTLFSNFACWKFSEQDKQKIFMAKYYCVRLHTLFGAALAAGLVVARLVLQRYMPHNIFS